MQVSRPVPSDDAREREAFDSLLVAIDDAARQAESDEGLYREVLLLLLKQGPVAGTAIWGLEEGRAVLKAVAPSNHQTTAPPADIVSRLIAQEVVALSDAESVNGDNGARGGRFLVGFRIAGSEGLAVEATVKSPATERWRRLLEAVAELVGHAETRLRYVAARRSLEALTVGNRVIQQFHAGDSLVETSLLVAAGLQDELGYDRCWICRRAGEDARVVSSSAPGDVARRQLLVRAVESVAKQAFSTGRDQAWSAGDEAAAGNAAARRLAEEGFGRRIAVLRLVPPGANEPVAAAVLEQFSGVARDDEASRRAVLVPHAALAMRRGLELDRRSWRGRWGEWTGPAMIRRGLAAAAVIGALVLLAMPVTYDVEAEGRIVPVGLRSLFAPADGVVSKIHVRHGQEVATGEAVLDLRSPELDLDRERTAGQISELTARLAAIQVLRTQGRSGADQSPADLSAQEEQVRAALAGADEQRKLIADQTARLSVQSPIAGVIDRWDLDEALGSRPVARGQHLCDVLDVDGDWKLELFIPDKRAAAVFASRSWSPELPVRYVLRTDPQVEHATRLSALGERTELDEAGRLQVRGTALLGKGSEGERRTGASVIARIECGRRSRAYVWFHELWESFRLLWL